MRPGSGKRWTGIRPLPSKGATTQRKEAEFDDARSGDFSPLRYAPKNVRVVLGLVTTKVGTLEKKDDLTPPGRGRP